MTNGLMSVIEKFIGGIDDDCIKKIFIRWALAKGENAAIYLAALNDEQQYLQHIGNCLNENLIKFGEWLKELCLKSMLDRYGTNARDFVTSIARNIVFEPRNLILTDCLSNEFVEYNQDYISEAAGTFFQQYYEQHVNGNEQWMFKRINAVVANIKGEENLFEQSDEIKEVSFSVRSLVTNNSS
jgi:hypothetical protein